MDRIVFCLHIPFILRKWFPQKNEYKFVERIYYLLQMDGIFCFYTGIYILFKRKIVQLGMWY